MRKSHCAYHIKKKRKKKKDLIYSEQIPPRLNCAVQIPLLYGSSSRPGQVRQACGYLHGVKVNCSVQIPLLLFIILARCKKHVVIYRVKPGCTNGHWPLLRTRASGWKAGVAWVAWQHRMQLRNPAFHNLHKCFCSTVFSKQLDR